MLGIEAKLWASCKAAWSLLRKLALVRQFPFGSVGLDLAQYRPKADHVVLLEEFHHHGDFACSLLSI
jgi:hypothetical protein